MAEFNTIDDFDIENKTVLVRVDVNAPVDPGSGLILDDKIINSIKFSHFPHSVTIMCLPNPVKRPLGFSLDNP